MDAVDELRKNPDLIVRREQSEDRLKKLRTEFNKRPIFEKSDVMCFCAGSLGRLEAGERSDLDLFVIAPNGEVPRLTEVRLLCELANLNDDLGFPSFSDEMRYLKIYAQKQIIDDTGKPRDDSENSFTTRMLLILESKPLLHHTVFQTTVQSVCENYFRDNSGKKNFRPLFLVNDLLRYWRTLCLNYEQCRSDPEKPWRKKNVNLKFSRLTTVFSTIAAVMHDQPQTAKDFMQITNFTPLERLANTVDQLSDDALSRDFKRLLEVYTFFLEVKDNSAPEGLLNTPGVKLKIIEGAEFIADFFNSLFRHRAFEKYSRFLIL